MDCDICILGAGPAGYTGALRAARQLLSDRRQQPMHQCRVRDRFQSGHGPFHHRYLGDAGQRHRGHGLSLHAMTPRILIENTIDFPILL